MNNCIKYMTLASLFRGLCLVNVAVIAIATSSVVAETIDEARNTLTQIWWRG